MRIPSRHREQLEKEADAIAAFYAEDEDEPSPLDEPVDLDPNAPDPHQHTDVVGCCNAPGPHLHHFWFLE